MPNKTRPKRTPLGEPSANNEKLSDHDPRTVFASDGRKLEDAEFVGSHSPDTDPIDGEPPQPPPRR